MAAAFSSGRRAGALAPTLDRLPKAVLESMAEAGAQAMQCLHVLDRGGLNLVGEVLRGHGTFTEYEHYPPDDVYDRDTHAQYYYHAHRGLAGEHGHFHTFLRAAGMPQGVEPVANAGDEPWPQGDDALSHLVAVSMDAYGLPIGLFTVNRWVTGDTWYRATDVIGMLDRFRIDHAYPSWPVNRWLGAMLVLFRPQIETLLRRRDAAVAAWKRAHPRADALEDRRLDVTAKSRISVAGQIASVRSALARRRGRTRARRR